MAVGDGVTSPIEVRGGALTATPEVQVGTTDEARSVVDKQSSHFVAGSEYLIRRTRPVDSVCNRL